MATCPLCNARAAKRSCPAKRTHICSVCCGTKREIEIDCPSDCAYLKSGRIYETEKKPLTAESAGSIRRFDDAFLHQYGLLIFGIYKEIVEERRLQPTMLDHDVVEVYKSLGATLKTLSSGLLYESLPEGGPMQTVLFRRLRNFIDSLISPESQEQRALRVSEAEAIVEFLVASASINGTDRPKSRRYLDWLTGIMAESSPKEENRIILP